MTTLYAPELRPEGERGITTSTGIQIGRSYIKPPRRDPQAISGPHRRRHPVRRAVLRAIGSTSTLLACVAIAATALLLTACGPSDIDADRDTAASLQDAQQQAVIDRHMALALLASRSRK